MSEPTPNQQSPTPRLIPLTQGFSVVVDESDFPELSQHKWCALNVRKWGKVYAVRAVQLPNGKQRIEYMHRVILDAQPGVQVDHIDGDGLNNSRSNLRGATASQNMANRGATKHNKSGYKGVTAWRNRWRAKVKAAGQIFYLGLFDTKEDAALAYDAKALALFGAFARLNFPNESRRTA